MRRRTALSLATSAALLVACGDDGDGGATDQAVTPAVAEDGTARIEVVMDDILFRPTAAEVPAGTTLVVDLVNEGGIAHDFVWVEQEQGSELVAPGEATTTEVGPFDAPARIICTVPGHEQAGMVFDVTLAD